jgi:hypothetical protein
MSLSFAVVAVEAEAVVEPTQSTLHNPAAVEVAVTAVIVIRLSSL